MTGPRPPHFAPARLLAGATLALAAALARAPACAAEAPTVAEDPAIEARMMAIAAEMRCVVCQNQTLADSHADLAADLRQQIREQLKAGQSEAQVHDWLTARYGDFVLYRPPLKPATWLLWFGPGLLLLGGLAGLGWTLRRRQRLGDEAFDPEPADAAVEDPHPDPRRR